MEKYNNLKQFVKELPNKLIENAKSTYKEILRKIDDFKKEKETYQKEEELDKIKRLQELYKKKDELKNQKEREK